MSKPKGAFLSEKDGYTITVRLSLEPGRLPTETSRFSTDTHTILTGQCPLPSVDDLDLPTLLAASEPVKVSWDKNDGTKIENTASTASTFENISAMLQKICPAAAESLSNCVLDSGGTESKNMSGDAFLASFCNVRLTHEEWMRASAARNKQDQEEVDQVALEQDLETLAKQRENQLQRQRDFIVQQQYCGAATRHDRTQAIHETTSIEDLLQQMEMLKKALSSTMQSLSVEHKERSIAPPPPAFKSNTAMTQAAEDCYITEEVCVMLKKLRALYEGHSSSMPRNCCKGKDKFQKPHVHCRLNGLPVVISLVESPPKQIKRRRSPLCARRSRSKPSYYYAPASHSYTSRTTVPMYANRCTDTCRFPSSRAVSAQTSMIAETDFAQKLTDCKFPTGKSRRRSRTPTLTTEGTQTGSLRNSTSTIRTEETKQPEMQTPISATTQTPAAVPIHSFSSIARSEIVCPRKNDNCTQGECSKNCMGRSTVGCPSSCPGLRRSDAKQPEKKTNEQFSCYDGKTCAGAKCDECYIIRKIQEEQTNSEEDSEESESHAMSTQTSAVDTHVKKVEKENPNLHSTIERARASKDIDTQTNGSTVSLKTSKAVDKSKTKVKANNNESSETKIKLTSASCIRASSSEGVKVDTIYNVQRPSRLEKMESSSSEMIVPIPPIQAHLVKKYGMHNIMQSAKVAPCTYDVVANDEIHSDFPYAPSFNSLPLDDDDAAEISARIEKAKSGNGVASGAQVYMAAADLRCRHQRIVSPATKEGRASTTCSSFSIINQEKLRDHKKLLYRYLLNELQKCNVKFCAQKNMPVTARKQNPSSEFVFRNKSSRNTQPGVSSQIQSSQKTGNKLIQSTAGCRTPPSKGNKCFNIEIDSIEEINVSSNSNTEWRTSSRKQYSKIINPKMLVSSNIEENSSMVSSSTSNSTRQSSNANASKQFSNMQSFVYRSAHISTTSAWKPRVRTVRKSSSDTSLARPKTHSKAEREKENRNNSCKMLWALSRARNLEKPSDIWDILPPGKSKPKGRR